jgi:hypothetical protein
MLYVFKMSCNQVIKRNNLMARRQQMLADM